MQPVYFAHGYREREAPFAAFFGSLMRQKNLIPSLDPPSESVNAAKLERHLGYTKGLVAVLASRSGSASPHIIFEISMCIRAGMPVLVFVEDSLPTDILPRQILQRRFSAKSYARETREHLHALEIFGSYIGRDHMPRYEPSVERRSCMLIGTRKLGKTYANEIEKSLEDRGYDVFEAPKGTLKLPIAGDYQTRVRNANLTICLLDDRAPTSMYFLGVANTCLRPTLTFSNKTNFPIVPHVPEEYQRKFLPPDDIERGVEILGLEIDLFEEDFIEIDSTGEAEKYAQELAKSASPTGDYSEQTRAMIIESLNISGDTYAGNHAMALGPNAYAQSANFVQIWNSVEKDMDLTKLAVELAELRGHLKSVASESAHDESIGAVAEAEIAAKQGQGPRVIEALAKAGNWAFNNATKIGVGVAVSALKSSLGY